jgi:cysteinyl-tRNA synthetase
MSEWLVRLPPTTYFPLKVCQTGIIIEFIELGSRRQQNLFSGVFLEGGTHKLIFDFIFDFNFDFHGGGADLQFPHHENEIAQSCCANKGSTYAKYWVHNGFLTVNGEKMSKSLKNFITVFDLLQKNITGVVIRYMLLATHYRKPFDFNEKALQDAQKSIDKFYQHILDCDFSLPFLPPSAQLLQALSNDLNTSTAFAFLHSLVKEFDQKWQLASDLHFLGLLDINYLTKNHQQNNAIHTNEIEQMILLRQEYKQNKQFALADKIRDDLLKKGIIIADNQQNTTWSFIKK